ncbi:site-specific DNA-methyltransferase [Aliarcobacter cryaerophilus]|uniref:site-specific DNA-methyltransferase n=1 Tax=Aliarcobacter cryaerophilus TaxID=28198 RepID=UPI003DA2EC5E
MTQLDGKSKDLVNENIEKLKEIFPEVFSEGKIDFSKLEEELGNFKEKSDERYNFTWNGKSEAKKIALTPSTGTLRPCKVESKDWDTTQNLYIEGDNLEVLKLLQKSYHKKVKMIYIDPPYNTGKDFVYKDNFRDNIKNYLEITGQVDSDGNKLSTNSETSGRYHSDWLNMMYPRLKLARNLLKDDGLIFISIDENEYENLKKVCDEIFGEDNYIGSIIWKNKFGSGAKTSGFIGVHEYIICYSRIKIMNITSELSESEVKKHTRKDEKYETRGGYRIQPLMTKSMDDRPNLVYPIEYNGIKIYPNKQWVWSRERMMEAIANNNVDFMIKDDGTVAVNSKQYLKDENGVIRKGKPTTFFDKVYTQNGTKELNELFDKKIFDFNKPIELIRYLISFEVNDTITINHNDIILDFFSGSATTAHAVMKLNSEDDGNRKFICVQLPETTDEKSEAHKAGYKNICEIGKERIRRAGEKVKSESGKTELDIGFKVLKLDSSNIKSWDSDFENLETNLLDAVENIKSDRNEEDLLYEILLKYGLDLTLPIEEKEVNGKKLFNIGFGALIICLDSNISIDITDEIIAIKKEHDSEITRVVFKDSGFKNATEKTNIIKTLNQNGIDEVVSV